MLFDNFKIILFNLDDVLVELKIINMKYVEISVMIIEEESSSMVID